MFELSFGTNGDVWVDPGGWVQGVRTTFRPKMPLFNFQTKIFPRKGTHSFIAQNPIFSPEKKCFFATRKDVESYTQMPGKCILALFVCRSPLP
jgi:hypothetical protein